MLDADTSTVVGKVLEVKRAPKIGHIGTDEMIDFEGFLVETTEIMECSGRASNVVDKPTLSRQKSSGLRIGSAKKRSTFTAPSTQDVQSQPSAYFNNAIKTNRNFRNRSDEQILALFLPPASSTQKLGLSNLEQLNHSRLSKPSKDQNINIWHHTM